MTIERVRVFVDERGQFGNSLAIRPHSAGLSDDECLAMATTTGTSETAFVDDADSGEIPIFVPSRKVPFAGHPVIGTAWWLARQQIPVTVLRTESGEVPVEVSNAGASLRTPAFRGVPWIFLQKDSVEDVRGADPSGPRRHDYVWAWANRDAGELYTRAFTSLSGTVEDPATGGAAIDLCATLKTDLHISQGAGSRITVRYLDDVVELSGRCASA